MAGHSAASLTASIRNNLSSTISSLDALTQSPEFDRSYSIQIRAVIESLQALDGHVHGLEQQLSSATVTCAAVLREKISGSLSQCSINITPMVKQLQRLDTNNVHSVSGEFWITLGRVTATQSRLFSFYTELLRKGDEGLQEENISGPAGEERLSQADDAISNASEAQDIFGDSAEAGATSTTLPIRNKTAAYTGQPPPPSMSADEPPPYTPSQDDAGVGSSTAPPPFPSVEPIGWFKRAFGAIADAVRPTPGPFVVALCEAVANGDVHQARSFLDQGANMNGTNQKGDTPLKVALVHRQLACLQMLIEAGALLKIDREPALFAAAKLGQLEAMQIFLDNGQRIDEANIAGQPYFVGVVKAANIAGITYLLEKGADAETADISGQCVLATAVAKGRIDVVEVLLKYGASADTEDVSGQPSIVTAVNKRNTEMVKLLLRHGASANAQEITGSQMLANVISRRNKEMAELLLEHDADPNATDIFGVTALANAIEKRDLDMVKLLLTHGASANVSNLGGQPVVLMLLQSKRYGPEEKGQVLKLLLEHGAPVDGSDIYVGGSVMQVAQEQGNAICIKLLREYGAK